MTDSNFYDRTNLDDITLPLGRLYYIIFYSVFIVFIFLGNSFIIYLYSKYRETRNHINMILISESVSDLIFAGGFIFWMTKLFKHPLLKNKEYCMLNFVFAFPMEHVSMWHIFLIALYRYGTLKWPFKSAVYFTSRRIKSTIIVIYSGCLMLGLLPVLGWNNWDDSNLSCYNSTIIPGEYFKLSTVIRTSAIVASTIVYALLLYKAVKITRRIHNDSNQLSDKLRDYSTAIQRKVTTFVLTIVLFFLICHLPKSCFLLFLGEYQDDFVRNEGIYWANFGGLVCSALNPLLYMMTDPYFKSALKKLIRK